MSEESISFGAPSFVVEESPSLVLVSGVPVDVSPPDVLVSAREVVPPVSAAVLLSAPVLVPVPGVLSLLHA
jgi:hypothetical protein